MKINSQDFVKKIVESIPYGLGRHLSKIPFRLRLGRCYTRMDQMLSDSSSWSIQQKVDFTLQRLNRIKLHAQTKIPFYHQLYKQAGVFDLELRSLEDVRKLPVITKLDIKANIHSFNGYSKINTGGTSGNPMAFYIDRHAWAREWAHMHYIWALKGYRYTNVKLTLRGRNLGTDLIRYNAVHNEFILNTYQDFSVRENALVILNTILQHKIRFIHGYPSAIFNVFRQFESSLLPDEILKLRSRSLIGLLGSEFPFSSMVDYLQHHWNMDLLSWYGHSEMCILAYDEYLTNNYKPLSTYGLAEVVDNKLIGTSFHNLDMPLIRYQTGDLVKGQLDGGLVSTFSITEGRVGDFVVDKRGKSIPLTALIFGRHHKAFELFDYIQVQQRHQGEIKLYITKRQKQPIKDIKELFDFSNVDLDFSVEWVAKPILSSSGKFKLKI